MVPWALRLGGKGVGRKWGGGEKLSQAVPEVTKQEGAQTKLRCWSHMVYSSHLKHTEESKGKEME